VSKLGVPFFAVRPASCLGGCVGVVSLALMTLLLTSFVKVEGAILGFPSIISLMVSVDVKQHWNAAADYV